MFVICVVFIYLILCALYESLFIPLAVILSVPFGLAGSFLFAKMFGLENNIYLQTGLIMLIGLLAKTAILLTEYASERRHQGMSITQAAVSAAEVRLRPILMTSLTMIFGMLPLMGLTQGAQPIISYNFGARTADRVKKAFQLLLVCSMIFTFVLWAGCMLVPKAFILIFSSDSALTEISVWAMRIYMGTFLFFGAQIACQQTFIALGQAAVSLFLALLRKVILLIPLIFILPLFFSDQVFAVFLAEPIADFLAVLVTVLMFTFRFRKILAGLRLNSAAANPAEKA